MKKYLSILVSAFFIILLVTNVAASGLEPGLIVDDKVKTGKSFTAEITLSGDTPVSACVFTVCYDTSVMQFSSAQLRDGIDGDLEYNDMGGTVQIVFLSTSGVQLGGETSLVEVKFKSGQAECLTNLIIYVEQAVSSSENRIDCSSGKEYTMAIQENIDGEVSRASGSSVSSEANSSSGSSRGDSAENSGNGGVSVYNGSIVTEEGEYQSATASFSSDDLDSSFGADSNIGADNTLFICGFIAAICLACAAGGIYLFGKKRAELKLASNRDNSDPEDKTEADNDGNETSPNVIETVSETESMDNAMVDTSQDKPDDNYPN